jgi:hypothetical protein
LNMRRENGVERGGGEREETGPEEERRSED